jgi:hypothetical protein
VYEFHKEKSSDLPTLGSASSFQQVVDILERVAPSIINPKRWAYVYALYAGEIDAKSFISMR